MINESGIREPIIGIKFLTALNNPESIFWPVVGSSIIPNVVLASSKPDVKSITIKAILAQATAFDANLAILSALSEAKAVVAFSAKANLP